ncbi:MAG TPA: xanthine dehydrogenase accessory protein XdhC [Casimicrobiaceae bacterium]|nr:xanthine dehydrogenase accessory protein XdhC [Casimicrobiaceae bacterium]
MRDGSTVPWLDALAAALSSDAHAMLVVLAGAKGSTPREAGTAMIVAPQACIGSIGGGHLEYEAIRIAREALRDNAKGSWLVRFPLAARLGQCCGGVATLSFSRIDANALAWLEAAQACARAGAPFALVSRFDADATSRLVVTRDDIRGTLGDARLDSDAIAAARLRLAHESDGATIVAAAGEGAAPLLLHVVRPEQFFVLVFGNGHVGRALVNVLGVVAARVRWIDSRADDFPAHVPANVEIVATDEPEDEIPHAPGGAFVVVTTHSHALDYTLIEAALARDDWRYLGLIGSKSKRAQFERRLEARGVARESFARIHCPIGANVGIRGKQPGAIAVAIAAEMLMAREGCERSVSAPRGLELTHKS